MKPEYKKILFCSDLSLSADAAWSTALDMAERYGARLFVLQVIPETGPYEEVRENPAAPPKEPALGDRQAAALQKLEDRYRHRLGAWDQVAFHVLFGVPIVEIVRFARDREIDLIVMGAAGSSARHQLHFGSTAENVARRAPCTVMCIRQPQR